MGRPDVAVDMEATLADVHRAMLRVYNAEHGTAYTMENIQWWDWVADEIAFEDFMRIADQNWVQDPLSIPACEWSPPLQSSLNMLADVEPYDIVTARNGGWYDPSDGDEYDDVNDGMRFWLDEHGIASFNAFHAISEGQSKAPLGYDVYVDDNPNLADELDEGQQQLMPVRPWNTDYVDHSRVIAVDSVAEAVQEILGPQLP